MTLPKKGSRTIEIEAVTYRWAVRDNGDHRSVVAEHVDEPGQALHVAISRFDHPGNVAITPKVVERLVREAIKCGWHPGRAGGAFRLTEIPSDLFG